MKKAISLLLTFLLLTAALTACAKKPATADEDVAPLDVLNAVWSSYSEEEKFPAAGGDYENHVEDAPGVFSMADPENVEVRLGLPRTELDKVDAIASLTHMMNENTFTAAAFHTVEGADTDALAKSLSEYLKNRRWICGMPDKFSVLLTVGGRTLVSVFGTEQNVDTFMRRLQEQYGSASVITKESGLF